MSQTTITDYKHPGGWTDPAAARQKAIDYCRQLEEGKVLYFDNIPYDFPDADKEFLLSQKQSGLRIHKNISYRPKTDVLRGAAADDPEGAKRLHEIMRHFSQEIVKLVDRFLSPYARERQLDFASYRPNEEKGRELSYHKRNDLMHVDAFPTRPTNGGRILRVFTNINPSVNRVWEISEPFEPLANKMAAAAGLGKYAGYATSASRKFRRTVGPILRTVGVKNVDRSPYDHFMLHFHDWLKENRDYQEKGPKIHIEFPPYSTWMVYTDTVPHSVLSGQFALEQTFIVPVSAMVAPEKTPLKLLEGICGTGLAN
ncbi:MAG TPA: Kdo hydroxylase family protein [Tepidisphaeraceae bacterium]|jgi:hypothetical protein|nr:Kdo hydroxylase family protein [Tepidisphaeraceae bacterium]